MREYRIWTSTAIGLGMAFSFLACASTDGGTGGSTSTTPDATGGTSAKDSTSDNVEAKGGTSSVGGAKSSASSKGGTKTTEDASGGQGGQDGFGGQTGVGGTTGAGGKSGVGGDATEPGGTTGSGAGESSCVQGVNTGSTCNPEVDTTECVRSTRTCTCEDSGKWACVTTSGSGGTTGAGGATTGSGGKSETGGSSGASTTEKGGTTGTGGVTGNGGTSGANTTVPATGGTPGTGPSTGPAKSMGYVGCSMSVNVLQGYEALGGKRLWGPIAAYNGMVVQNWAKDSDNAWKAFDEQVSQNGKPTAVWVMICIFSNQVTYDETKQIIANARKRAPDATIYITGQPLYAQGLSCDLAGQGGPEKTDSMAKQAAADATQNVIYGGAFGPLTSAQRSDSCHANTEGQKALGQQAIDKWGK